MGYTGMPYRVCNTKHPPELVGLWRRPVRSISASRLQDLCDRDISSPSQVAQNNTGAPGLLRVTHESSFKPSR